MSSGFAEVRGLLLNGWVKRSILWLKIGKWETYILSYIRKSLALKLILRIRPQIMYREILAGFSEALRKWDPIESRILHSNLNFNLQTTLKKCFQVVVGLQTLSETRRWNFIPTKTQSHQRKFSQHLVSLSFIRWVRRFKNKRKVKKSETSFERDFSNHQYAWRASRNHQTVWTSYALEVL